MTRRFSCAPAGGGLQAILRREPAISTHAPSRLGHYGFDSSATQDVDDVLCLRADEDRIFEIVVIIVGSHTFEVAYLIEQPLKFAPLSMPEIHNSQQFEGVLEACGPPLPSRSELLSL
jgi:hypothetical protein